MSDNIPRVLSLNGGGVRVVSSLTTLEDIGMALEHELKILKQELKDAFFEEPLSRLDINFGDWRPCEVFTHIGGTSAGAILVVMFACFEMTVRQALGAFMTLAKAVFDCSKVRKGLNIAGSWSLTGSYGAAFSSTNLRKAIEKQLKKMGFPINKSLRSDTKPRCIALVYTAERTAEKTAKSRTDLSIDLGFTARCIRSWGPSDVGPEYWTISDALLAATAAPMYFSSHKVGGRVFVDAAVAGLNNPSVHILHEVRRTTNVHLKESLCLNIGTGKEPLTAYTTHPLKPWGIVGLIKPRFTEARSAAEIARNDCNNDRDASFFSLNVESGFGDISLHEHDKMDYIVNRTKQYNREEAEAQSEILSTVKRILDIFTSNYVPVTNVCRPDGHCLLRGAAKWNAIGGVIDQMYRKHIIPAIAGIVDDEQLAKLEEAARTTSECTRFQRLGDPDSLPYRQLIQELENTMSAVESSPEGGNRKVLCEYVLLDARLYWTWEKVNKEKAEEIRVDLAILLSHFGAGENQERTACQEFLQRDRNVATARFRGVIESSGM